MRTVILPLISLIICTHIPYFLGAQQPLDSSYFSGLKYNHDLNLPAWGPYTKKYIGVSHIPDVEKGIRFDLSVFPGFYRRKVDVPNVFFESGFHPWEAAPNLEYFSFRHELEWKDQVYTDISYSQIDDHARLVRIEAVNNTDKAQSLVMHMMASIHFPSIREYNPHTPLDFNTISLPDYATWIDALDYADLQYAVSRPQDELGYDGKLRGEIRDHGLINGSGIGQDFGAHSGDEVRYQIELSQGSKDAVLWFRYRLPDSSAVALELTGLIDATISLAGTGQLTANVIELGNIHSGSHELTITTLGTTPIIIDGFTILERKDISEIETKTIDWEYVPEITRGPVENSIVLKYNHTDQYYGISWDYGEYEVRKWHFKELSDNFRRQVNSHVGNEFSDGTRGHFTNVFLRPINVEANSSLIINSVVCTGTLAEVEKKIGKSLTHDQATDIYENARGHIFDYEVVPAGEKYLFSNKRMAATTITNVVYPVYTQQQYIRHHAPGRWWDCLYTWDAGFIGIGLAQQNLQRGIESLNTYVNEPDEQSAFIHHGTPLPVQHYLFQELWNKSQSEVFLNTYYPKLKKYYDFIAGNNKSSSTRMNSGLLRTWDYFYNSGGWDDYPPQHHLRENPTLYQQVTPVVSTAHCIRIAKILQMAASHLQLERDVIAYDKDISRMSQALQKHSWDAESGYFGYVEHDETGKAKHILQYQDSINYNMGLGGASPIIAGICTKDQEATILSHLKTRGEIWSNIGLSAVDQSAPYYSHSGYWNGTVWMPHQWFIWKTMLDLGESKFAYKIAKTALDLWKTEVESTYNCSEHFVIETGRGAGWHQFGGLSTPVLSWFNAYYQQGTLTTGFNVWIQEQQINEQKTTLRANLKLIEARETFSVVACLNPDVTYQVYWNDQKVAHTALNTGTLSIDIRNGGKEGILEIKPIEE